MILSAGSSPAWLLPGLLALGAYVVAALLPQRSTTGVRAALVLGWLAHAAAILVDTSGAGAPDPGARFGFALALSATLWLVIAVYLVESRSLPLPGVRRSLAALGLLAVGLALLFPGELRPHMLSRWEPLHVVTAIAAYGLFGAAVLHAALLNRADRQMRALPQHPEASGSFGLPLLRLERLTFRFVVAGFVLLTATLLVGLVVAPWQWSHKTVFSLLAWVVFAALLAGRQVFGWRGSIATRWLYAGAALLLLAYIGSRFVFEVVLHRPPAM
ncbi:MAG TPA: cytochrome c biogenesis protein CcsA [Albitalea sp.]